jgi:hypothetical protein
MKFADPTNTTSTAAKAVVVADTSTRRPCTMTVITNENRKLMPDTTAPRKARFCTPIPHPSLVRRQVSASYVRPSGGTMVQSCRSGTGRIDPAVPGVQRTPQGLPRNGAPKAPLRDLSRRSRLHVAFQAILSRKPHQISVAVPISGPWLSVSELHLHCVSRLAYQYGSLRNGQYSLIFVLISRNFCHCKLRAPFLGASRTASQ